MAVELRVPEVGESVTEANVLRWLKAEGQHVEKDEPVVELETDKATMELPAPAAGTLVGPLKPAGQTASIGEVIGYIGDAAATTAPAQTSKPPKPPETPEPAASLPPNPQSKIRNPQSSPPPETRKPSKTPAPPAPAKPPVPPAPPNTSDTSEPAAPLPPTPNSPPPDADHREEEVVPMTPLRRRIAQRLVEAQHNAALLTTINEVDMSGVLALRKQLQEAFQAKYAIKLGLMSFFVKGVIDALRQTPALNAEIRDTNIVYRNYFDIGIAVSTERGLVVPVLRDAQRMSFGEVERAIGDFAARAGTNRLRVDELRGGTFTITNGGVFGSLLSTPIVNPPQSGVLGMHAIQDRPVARNGAVVVRPMMYLALTYDHRIVDGREAITFLKRVIAVIEEPARMLVEV